MGNLKYFTINGKEVICNHPKVEAFHEYGGLGLNPSAEPVHFIVMKMKDGTKVEFGGYQGAEPFIEADKYLSAL